jgi:hypothetical protein
MTGSCCVQPADGCRSAHAAPAFFCKCFAAKSRYQVRQPGLAIASLLMTFSSGWPSPVLADAKAAVGSELARDRRGDEISIEISSARACRFHEQTPAGDSPLIRDAGAEAHISLRLWCSSHTRGYGGCRYWSSKRTAHRRRALQRELPAQHSQEQAMGEMISATPTLRAPIRRWRSRLCGPLRWSSA